MGFDENIEAHSYFYHLLYEKDMTSNSLMSKGCLLSNKIL